MLEGVVELVALEDVVVRARVVAGSMLRVHGPPDRPDRSGLTFDPDHDPFENARIVHADQRALRKPRNGRAAAHQGKDTIAAVGLRDLFQNPFSFLFARSRNEDRLIAYVLREHDRGRALTEILEDPYVRNRTTPHERDRLLDNPDVIRALGQDVIQAARSQVGTTA